MNDTHELRRSGVKVLAAPNMPLLRDVPGHYVKTPFFITAEMFGDVGFEVAGGEISSLVDKPVSEPHVHDVPEIYLLLAPAAGDAVIDVFADNQHYELASPAAVFIPAGVTHRFITKRAARGSFCLGLLLTAATADGA